MWAGWILNGDFFLNGTGALDWAGGTIVHQASGAAALALALVLGRRKIGFSKEEAQPHNVPLVLIGAAILWFGWFGFNTGVYGADLGQTSLIFLNTLICPAAGMLGWLVVPAIEHPESSAFEILEHEAQMLTREPTGVGFDPPAWLMALEDEVRRWRRRANSIDDQQVLQSILPAVALTIEDVQQQLNSWATTKE